jgi:carboxyl-terminal processing protease
MRTRMVRTIGIVLLFAAACALLPSGNRAEEKLTFPSGSRAADTLTIIDKMRIEEDIRNYVRSDYVDSLNLSDLYDGAIEGMIGKLDPHSSYMPPQAADDFAERIRGEFGGIGITFTMVKDSITVIDLVEGGPSEAAGLKSRNRIVKIDGKDAIDLSQDAIKERLRGGPGTKVALLILRPGRAEPFEKVITRGIIEMNSVSHAYMIDSVTGYISLSRFSMKTRLDVVSALDRLHKKGMQRLVLDLRTNSGGVLDAAVEVVNLFLKDGKIVYTQGRKKSSDHVWNASGKAPYADLPLIVMVNHGSASASEIVAGALQDHDRALIVGQTSFGKGLVMNPIRLSAPDPRTPNLKVPLGTLMLSVSRYYTPSGRLIQRPYSGSREEYVKEGFDDVDPNAADSSKTGKPVYKTDLGRNVYGGGGITPDVTIPPLRKLNPLERAIRSTNLCFEFADEYLNRHNDVPGDFPVFLSNYHISPEEIAKFGTFIRSRGIKPDSLSTFDAESGKLADKFDIPRTSLDRMEKVLEADKVHPDENLFERSVPFVERELKQEIARMVWGPEERFRVWHTDDTELITAMRYFPQATELLASRLALRKE